MARGSVIGVLQRRRNQVAAAIALAGLLAGAFLYVRAVQAEDEGERLDDSKQYLRQMEVYGGTANVLASELREWFSGLWRGRSLAFTVGVLSLLVAGAARLALTPLPPPPRRPGGPP